MIVGWRWKNRKALGRYLKIYDARSGGRGEPLTNTCLNCSKGGCALAGIGNQAGINENNGCWQK